MQRMLVTVAVVALVFASLAVGALASHWPFWQRAWQWHVAGDAGPARLSGPELTLLPSRSPLPLRVSLDARLAPRAGDAPTRMLLVGDATGHVAAWTAPSIDLDAPIPGGGLAAGLLAPLFGALQEGTAIASLDVPLRVLLDEWRNDPRGDITPRQLLWEMSGLAAQDFVPLNPFSARAQLSSGPDFNRAAMRTPLAWPPGSHFEPSPANAQLLSQVAGVLDGRGFATALQQRLWSRFAAQPAAGTLDHPRGNLAAHCCLQAAPVDWLRLGLLLAADGVAGGIRILPEGYVAEMTVASPVHPGHGLGYRLAESRGVLMLSLASPGRRLMFAPATGRALLWVGEGEAPAWLEELLLPGILGNPDNGSGG